MKRAARIARWLAFVVTALAAADVVSTLVAGRLSATVAEVSVADASATPIRKKPRANDNYYVAPIVKRNLFGIKGAEEQNRPPPPDDTKLAELPASSLAQRFQLVGTVVSSNRAESVAVVQERAGAQDSNIYQIGQKIAEEAELVSVEPQRIVLDVGGRKEQISIELEGDQPGGGAGFKVGGPAQAVSPAPPAGDLGEGIRRNPDGSFTLDSRMVEGQLANLSELLTQARAVPNFNDGKTDGFRLFSIKRGSIFDQIGLRNGDVVRKVNQNELNDPAVALNVFQELRTSRDFQVTVLRNNQEQTLTYQVR